MISPLNGYGISIYHNKTTTTRGAPASRFVDYKLAGSKRSPAYSRKWKIRGVVIYGGEQTLCHASRASLAGKLFRDVRCAWSRRSHAEKEQPRIEPRVHAARDSSTALRWRDQQVRKARTASSPWAICAPAPTALTTVRNINSEKRSSWLVDD